MAKWIIGLLALGIALTTTLAGAITSTETDLEYSRITMGGGHSSTEKYQVDDALTQNVTATAQQSSRFEVLSVKADSGPTASSVSGWEQYD